MQSTHLVRWMVVVEEFEAAKLEVAVERLAKGELANNDDSVRAIQKTLAEDGVRSRTIHSALGNVPEGYAYYYPGRPPAKQTASPDQSPTFSTGDS